MPVDAKTRFYTKVKLGPRRELTPEGFLVCYDVPICRTGWMLYGPDETPVTPGPGGVTKIWRRAEEVFRPETIASFNGKPVVNDHPSSGEVTPETWKELCVGVVLHPRRGVGIQDDLMLADFMITDAEAIRVILEEDKDEVSCGYDAEYRELAPGEGEQLDIVGNHVALVDSGRCGARCSIGDSAPTTKSKRGGSNVSKKFIDKLTKVFSNPAVAKALDEEMSEPMNDEEPAKKVGDTHNVFNIHGAAAKDESEEGRMKWDDKALDSKFDEFEKKTGDNHKAVMDSIGELSKKMADATYTPAHVETGDNKEIEGELEEEAPGEKHSTGDSGFLGDAWQDTVAMAEIIAPGLRIATMDAAAAPKKTLDAICDMRRKALAEGLKDEDTAKVITQVRGRALDSARLGKLVCSDVRHLFRSVAVVKQNENTQSTVRSTVVDSSTATFRPHPAVARQSLADLNKRNAEFYGGGSK